jgi:hypothetical protein
MAVEYGAAHGARAMTTTGNTSTARNEEELDPDQAAALRRLRATFGFVEVLAVLGHEADQGEGDNEAVED